MNPHPAPSFETTIHVRDTCLCLHVKRAARALDRYFDAALQPVDITSGQFSLLMSLNQPEPPSLSSIAALLVMDRTTLTANLKPLERRGLVETETSPKDKRARLLRLTEKGRALLVRALPIWERSHAEIERKLTTLDVLRAELLILSQT